MRIRYLIKSLLSCCEELLRLLSAMMGETRPAIRLWNLRIWLSRDANSPTTVSVPRRSEEDGAYVARILFKAFNMHSINAANATPTKTLGASEY